MQARNAKAGRYKAVNYNGSQLLLHAREWRRLDPDYHQLLGSGYRSQNDPDKVGKYREWYRIRFIHFDQQETL